MTRSFVLTFFLMLSVVIVGQEIKGLPDAPFQNQSLELKSEMDTSATEDAGMRMKVWQLHNNGEQRFVEMDTLQNKFYNFNPIYKTSIANNYLGNLGTPYESMIYFTRPRDLDFGFSDVYRDYLFLPEDYVWFNTKVPYTNLFYTSGGPKAWREESLQITFSRNINKDWNITGFGNLIYARGLYDYQSTKHTNFTFQSSYVRPRYEAYFLLNENNLINKENGGLSNWDELLYPENFTNIRNPEDLSTHFTEGVQSQLYNTNLYVKHKYNIGFEKPIKMEDTTLYKFIPVTSLVHTFNYSVNQKRYQESTSQIHTYTDDQFIMDKRTFDWMANRIVSNELGLYLNEGVNKYAIFGIGAYVGHEFVQVRNKPWYTFEKGMDTLGHAEAIAVYSSKVPSMTMDSLTYDYAKGYNPYNYTNTKVGGTIYKRLGKSFFYDLKGEVFLQGYKAGDYLLDGEVTMRFNKLDSVFFKGTAEFSGRTPYYYQSHYHSNYYWWDNDFDKVNNQRFTGEISWPKIHASANFSIENIFGHIYFNQYDSIPMQAGDVQIMALDLKKEFVMGKFHWDNNVVLQVSSDKEIIAVPDIAAYSNFYYQDKFFDVLSMQLGFEGYYHTEYYAPIYLAPIGRFANQNEKKIGNYPLLNVYANFHLKRMRFFVKYFHVNQGLGPRNYFASPDYPFNPRMLKVGLSWNFYD